MEGMFHSCLLYCCVATCLLKTNLTSSFDHPVPLLIFYYCVSQGNKICFGTQGCVNRLWDLSQKPGCSTHMGLWDRGAHSQSETSVIRGQSGEGAAPRTKGVLSASSQHLMPCSWKRSSTIAEGIWLKGAPIERYAEVMENGQLLPLWYKFSPIQRGRDCIRGHNGP